MKQPRMEICKQQTLILLAGLPIMKLGVAKIQTFANESSPLLELAVETHHEELLGMLHHLLQDCCPSPG